METKPSGLDAAYYDFPDGMKSAQDLIEHLGLDFANGNILKSLVRQYGPKTKLTHAKYEAEKRYFFAKRHLARFENSNSKKIAACDCDTIGPKEEAGHWHRNWCAVNAYIERLNTGWDETI